MILYYAPGGGLGHISRAIKLMQQWRIEDYKIITSAHTATRFVDNKHLVIIPKEDINKVELLNKLLSTEPVTSFYIDTFPCGLTGELNQVSFPSHIDVNYVCRRLKWRAYEKHLISNCHFKTTYLLEDPEPEHLSFIQKSSEHIDRLKITLPSHVRIETTIKEQYHLPLHRDIWLISHSDNPAELEALISYAKDIAQIENCHPYLLVNTNIEGKHFNVDQVIFHCPSYELFSFCQRIISACGFNMMQETQEHSIKHFFIPFERRFDDQFWRAQKRKVLRK